MKALIVFLMMLSCEGNQESSENLIDDPSQATLAGTDHNKNGVRDDIEAWIKNNSDDPERTRYLMAYAKKLREQFLIEPENRRQQASEINLVSDCYALEFDDESEQVLSDLGKILGLSMNSKKRKAFMDRLLKRGENIEDLLPSEHKCHTFF